MTQRTAAHLATLAAFLSYLLELQNLNGGEGWQSLWRPAVFVLARPFNFRNRREKTPRTMRILCAIL